MKKHSPIVTLLLFMSCLTYGQDKALIYSNILSVDSLSKNEIFDKTLIWCSKTFTYSKSAINVKEREGGIIAGKAYYQSTYKVPKKQDSTLGLYFNNYYFDWLIEIKDNKLRFTAKNIVLKEMDRDYNVTNKKQPPYEVWLQPKSKTELDWHLSKEYLIINLNKLISTLEIDLMNKDNNW